jgi:hypothetical protein
MDDRHTSLVSIYKIGVLTANICRCPSLQYRVSYQIRMTDDGR